MGKGDGICYVLVYFEPTYSGGLNPALGMPG